MDKVDAKLETLSEAFLLNMYKLFETVAIGAMELKLYQGGAVSEIVDIFSGILLYLVFCLKFRDEKFPELEISTDNQILQQLIFNNVYQGSDPLFIAVQHALRLMVADCIDDRQRFINNLQGQVESKMKLNLDQVFKRSYFLTLKFHSGVCCSSCQQHRDRKAICLICNKVLCLPCILLKRDHHEQACSITSAWYLPHANCCIFADFEDHCYYTGGPFLTKNG